MFVCSHNRLFNLNKCELLEIEKHEVYDSVNHITLIYYTINIHINNTKYKLYQHDIETKVVEILNKIQDGLKNNKQILYI